ncbi:Surface polysaccharide O-acyltransferase, integral membrane enzyme [Prevotella sp. ne3005]|uniref:acyltransferase n=1 Tax=Prevotella sp. ne3005 TaxID=1761887 RepID=UPI0008ACC880|nr:Surface polysaccharide O-acyltransferase, integral membrane enzyme [Prevotella sp. ne3005]
MGNKTTERIQFIDVIKIVAMIGVVGLHTTAGVPLIYATCSMSIPLFFMSTGFLMYDRDYSWKYIMWKIFHVLKYVVIANLVYWLIVGISYKSFNFNSFISSISILGEPPFWHFWFFGSLLLVYMILPLFKIKKSCNFLVVSVLFFFLQVVFLLNLLKNEGRPFEAGIPQVYRLYTWIFYCLMGGVMKSFMDRLPSVKLWFVLFVVGINGMFQFLLTPYMNDVRCEFFYSSFVVMVCCITIFIYISQFNYEHEPVRRVISELSSLFLPVFTIHIFLINPVFNMVQPSVGMLTRPVSWPIVVLISILISYILMHIKYFNSLIRI